MMRELELTVGNVLLSTKTEPWHNQLAERFNAGDGLAVAMGRLVWIGARDFCFWTLVTSKVILPFSSFMLRRNGQS